MLKENYEEVQKKITEACKRAGRNREEVTLIAVSKTKPVEMMREAMQCGIVTFGENKVQEIVEKQKELAALFNATSIPLFVFIPMKGDPQLFRGAADKATYKKAIDEFLLK